MSSVVATSLGRVRGEAGPAVHRFQRLPYAAPPVGALRWRAPQPPAPWSGELDATQPGPTAPQILGIMRDLAPQAEDCLYANVWTPDPNGRRPVMVFIHGGGFTAGASTHAMYDGAALAARGDLVVVSFNYRLGALGYADVAALAGDDGAFDVNLGLRDQLAALQWVQRHVASFGGDPEQVTVFGQSAGAMSVTTLLACPAARGLFVRAIAMSGAGHHTCARSESASIAQRLLDALELGPGDLHRLRELPAEAIVRAQAACQRAWSLVGATGRPLRNANMTLLPAIDGELVPEPPVDAAARGAGGDVPLLLGTTRDEWRFWIFLTDVTKRDLTDAALLRVVDKRVPGRAVELVDAYRAQLSRAASGPAAPWEIFSALESDRVFALPAQRLADARRGAAAPTYVYQLDWQSPLFEGQMGACHTLDIPFVLGAVDDGFGRVFTGGGEGARALSQAMLDAWIAFARGGDPSSEALGAWPAHVHGSTRCMTLGTSVGVRERARSELDALWSDLI